MRLVVPREEADPMSTPFFAADIHALRAFRLISLVWCGVVVIASEVLDYSEARGQLMRARSICGIGTSGLD